MFIANHVFDPTASRIFRRHLCCSRTTSKYGNMPLFGGIWFLGRSRTANSAID